MRTAHRWNNEVWTDPSFPTDSVTACLKINIQYSQGCLSNFKVRLSDVLVCVKT